MTTYTIPSKNKGVHYQGNINLYKAPAQHDRRPATASAGICLSVLPLYEVKRLDGSYAVTTVQGGRVQMRGNKRACEDWVVENTFVEENA